jgi:hypothetical protein
MNKAILTCVLVLSFAAVPCSADRKWKEYAPLRDQILTIKTVFLAGGPPQVLDKAYTELQKWGRFQVVSDPTQADVIFEFRYAMARAPQTAHVSVYDPNTGDTASGSATTPGVWTEFFTITDVKTKDVLYEDGREGSPNLRSRITHYSMALDMLKDLRKRIDATEVTRVWEYGIQVSNRNSKYMMDISTLDEKLAGMQLPGADGFRQQAIDWRHFAEGISTSQTEKDLANATLDEILRKQNIERIEGWRDDALKYACRTLTNASPFARTFDAARPSLPPDVIGALDAVEADEEALGKDCSSELAKNLLRTQPK